VFSTVDELRICVNELLKNNNKNSTLYRAEQGKFSITEIKSKLQSNIRNVTFVISCDSIIGEV